MKKAAVSSNEGIWLSVEDQSSGVWAMHKALSVYSPACNVKGGVAQPPATSHQQLGMYVLQASARCQIYSFICKAMRE